MLLISYREEKKLFWIITILIFKNKTIGFSNEFRKISHRR